MPEVLERGADLARDHGLAAVEPVGDDPDAHRAHSPVAGAPGLAANLTPVIKASPRSALAVAVPCAAAALARPRPPAPSPAPLAALSRGPRARDRRASSSARRSTAPAALRAPCRRGEVRFPDDLYVTLYGAPQLINTVLGQLKPKRGRSRQAERRARDYERAGDAAGDPRLRPDRRRRELDPGPRSQVPDPPARRDHRDLPRRDPRGRTGGSCSTSSPAARPRSGETKALADWVAEPDVDIGIDPEWNVGPKGVPGQTTGSISAAEINAVSRHLDRIVRREDLPPKVLIVHQFTKKMIDNRRAIEQRDGVQVLLNFDGIGSPAAEGGRLRGAGHPRPLQRLLDLPQPRHEGDEPGHGPRPRARGQLSPVPIAAMAGRIVLFGATGYTGRLTAKALTEHRREAAARRPQQGRRSTRSPPSSGGELETAVADVSDPGSVRSLLGDGDVMLTTVGPFARWGEPAIEAAIDAGCPYIDSTGEPAFIRRTFEEWGPRGGGERRAAADRARLRLGPGQPRRRAGAARGRRCGPHGRGRLLHHRRRAAAASAPG